MRALVTGCAGFIGSHLTEALLDAGHSVVGIDCFNDNYGRAQKLANLRQVREWTNFEFVPIDLSRGDLTEFVESAGVVFHLAAEPGVRSSWGTRYGRYVQNNIVATQHILQAGRGREDLRIVFASSSSVYGSATPGVPSTEGSPTRPISPYGQTKLSAEQLCGLHRAELGMDIVCLRYFTVFGPRQRPDMAFHRFLRAALLEEPIEVFGDGRQTRDFTYVQDVVAATLAAASGPSLPVEVLNIGGGSPTSLRAALEIVQELTGRTLEINHAPREHGDARDTAADTTLARELLGFAPQTGLEQGLQAELDWLAPLVHEGGSVRDGSVARVSDVAQVGDVAVIS
ncbi:MAG TPA: NAD-dependent epimerase/dehydratase family protein [Solirubrobacteraceae bacterium]|jgi:UDP-glucose 4-epimerase